MSNYQAFLSSIINDIYSSKNMSRRDYLNCKAILSNPNFNNHSVAMINGILGVVH